MRSRPGTFWVFWADLSGALERFSIWSPPVSPALPFPMRLARRRRWLPPSGASSLGKSLKDLDPAPNCIWASCLSFTPWQFFWWRGRTAEPFREPGYKRLARLREQGPAINYEQEQAFRRRPPAADQIGSGCRQESLRSLFTL